MSQFVSIVDSRIAEYHARINIGNHDGSSKQYLAMPDMWKYQLFILSMGAYRDRAYTQRSKRSETGDIMRNELIIVGTFIAVIIMFVVVWGIEVMI